MDILVRRFQEKDADVVSDLIRRNQHQVLSKEYSADIIESDSITAECNTG